MLAVTKMSPLFKLDLMFHLSGHDEGKVYAALITGAGGKPPSPDPAQAGTMRKRRRRRKRRSHKGSDTAQSDPLSVGPASQSAASDQPQEQDTASPAPKAEVTDSSAVGSLGLLVAYSDSDTATDSAEDSCSRQASSHEESRPQIQASPRKEKLPVPASIQDMFVVEDKEPGPSKAKPPPEETLRSTDGNTLGYFEADEILSSDEEVQSSGSGGAFKANTQISDVSVSREWDKEKAQWKLGNSILSTYTCWKCSNVGHLAQDCTVAVKGGGARHPGGVASNKVRIPKSLQGLFAVCREVKSRKGQRCSDCGAHNNLAYCLDCK